MLLLQAQHGGKLRTGEHDVPPTRLRQPHQSFQVNLGHRNVSCQVAFQALIMVCPVLSE